jgi:hypothetical protein
VLAATVLTSLASAVMWPVFLIKLTDVIDNLWTIAIERADLAGKELAQALLTRSYGSRPVTLVGYSLGARVIFSCLKELSLLLHSTTTTTNSSSSHETHANNASERSAALHSNKDSSMSRTPHPVTPAAQSKASVALPKQTDFVEYVYDSDDDLEVRPLHTTVGKGPDPDSTFLGVSDAVRGTMNTMGQGVSSLGRGVYRSVSWLARSTPPSKTACIGEADTTTPAINTHMSAVTLKSLVQDVVVLGTPVSANSQYWKGIRQVVSGRLINGYSNRDLILGLIYRVQRFNFTVAGISQVEVVGVENVDLSDLVTAHTDYGRRVKEILQRLDLQQQTSQPQQFAGHIVI